MGVFRKMFKREPRVKINSSVSGWVKSKKKNPDFWGVQKLFDNVGVIGFNKSVYEKMKNRLKHNEPEKLQPDPNGKPGYSFDNKECNMEGTLDSIAVIMAKSEGVLFYDIENGIIPDKKMAVLTDMKYFVISCHNSFFNTNRKLPDCDSHLITPRSIMVSESADLALDFYFSYFNAKLNPDIPFAFISKDRGFMNGLNYSIDSPRRCYIISPISNNFGILSFIK
ncbi:hypothetical protein SNEBB_004296 [Seison nebaliae]|nr:hypothetical protein SNEBB_004296 [Seison nebaliae]